MKGKQIKVIEYNLTFGTNARLVNVLGLFRYKKNNNLYIIYSDVNNNYNIVYYGSSHIKETSVLSMECKDPNDKEIIKEYIYKITNNESLDNYELQPLDKIEGIEIIGSNKLELKKETIDNIVESVIPKEEKKVENNNKIKKKKSPKILLFFLIIIIIGCGGYYFYTNYFTQETTIKQIICNKKYEHEELNAQVEEEQIFNFNINDKLEKTDITKIYTFNTESEYYDFINTGTYYKYMPENNTEGGWDKDDETYTYKTVEIERIDANYKKPTDYEEVLSYYNDEEYTCEEKVVN